MAEGSNIIPFEKTTKSRITGGAVAPMEEKFGPENPIFEIDSTLASKQLKVAELHFWQSAHDGHVAEGDEPVRWSTPLYGGGGFIPGDNDYVHYRGRNFYILNREFTYDEFGRLVDVVITVREHGGERHVIREVTPTPPPSTEQD